MLPAARRALLLASAAVLALPAGARATGLPNTFGRSIVATGTAQGLRVSDFETATRAVAGRKVGVKVRVTAATVDAQARRFDLAIASCTGGSLNSPLCRPAVSIRLTFGPSATTATRTVRVARPSARRDGIRITLNAVGARPVWPAERVGGGGGSGEILLNSGTWRFHPGTWWGVVAQPPSGFSLEAVKFNSRRFEWTAGATEATTVLTQLGYAGDKPVHTFTDVVAPGKLHHFFHTPGTPVQSPRTAPRALDFRATAAGAPVFTVSVPLPAWNPSA